MTTTIGRASLPADPSEIRWNGDELTLDGWVRPTTALDTNHAQALRDQLLGMVDNPDEDVFPLTCSVAAYLDGFYRVRSVRIGGLPGLTDTQGLSPYTIVLERATAGFATPAFEILSSLTVRTNSHSVTTPTGIVTAWYPAAGYTMEIDPTATIGPIATEDGSKTLSGYSVAAPLSTTAYQSWVKPADYYKSQAKIEVQYGSTWHAIHGRDLPLAVGTNWRISNGRVRMYPSTTGGNGRFTVEHYPANAWEGKEYGILNGTSFVPATEDSSGNALTATAMVNRPEIVVVRTRHVNVTYDWVVRRGDLWIEVAITQPAANTNQQWGVGVSTAEAMTAFTGGARATANDAAGSRCLISIPSTVSTDLVNGKVYLTTAADSAVVQVCPDYYFGGGGSDTSTRDYFLAARSERQRIVPR